MSAIKQKILLLLLGGLALGYSYTPSRQWKVLKTMGREWGKINEKELRKKINELYRSKAIKRQENSDGSVTITLTEKGRMKALTYKFEEIKVNNGNWDKKWRIVAFDVPEKLKNGRNALRDKLKEVGFYELQKSLWVFPYECKNEVDFIIEYFDLRKYVRFGILDFIDNELHLKKSV